MTDINTRGKLPFTVVSSSVDSGYTTSLSNSVGQNIELVNYHKDEYGALQDAPLQGPFTQQHVGGNQHRHIELNRGTDNIDNRPEGFIVSGSTNSIKIYGPDINGADKPRAILTRGNTAKSPINISNVQTSGNVAGNFEHNYQVVQTVGRRITNNLIVDDFIASGNLTTQFITGTQIYSLPDIGNNSKSVFVERFNAPGGKEESSRGVLDREGEEFAPNNSLVTRNIKVRQPFYNQLTQHTEQFNLNNTIHGVNRNTINTLKQSYETADVSNIELASLTGSLSIDTSDNFGISVALNSIGNILAVGAHQDESGSNGASSGVAYIFTSGSSGFVETARLTGSLAVDSSDNFGISVSLNSQGNVLAVGAYRDEDGFFGSSGVAYIFTSGSTGYVETARLTGSLAVAPSDNFGISVALNSIGNILAVGAWGDEAPGSPNSSGVVYIFTSGSSGYIETAILTGSLAGDSTDWFGFSVAINSSGNIVAVGARNDESGSNGLQSGVAYIFTSGSTGYVEAARLTGSLAIDGGDNFGFSVSLNSVGNILAVGAHQDESVGNEANSGIAYIFTSGSTGYIETDRLTGSLATNSSDYFGTSVKLNSTGNILAVGATSDESGSSETNFGVVYIFTSGSTGFNETGRLTSSVFNNGDNFGYSLSLNSFGNILAAGAYEGESSGNGTNSGVVYVNELFFTSSYVTYTASRNDNFWIQHAIPSTDLRYKWIADSVTSSQQPIQYQSYNENYSRGGQFTDLQFEQRTPFGDHLGITGAIDKEEMHLSTYTNTMYRERNYLYFTNYEDLYVDMSDIASEISEKDFSISFWTSFPENISNGNKTLIKYSNSLTQNNLFLNVSSSLASFQINGTDTTNEYELSSSLLDNTWHLVTLVSDTTIRRRRIRTFSGNTIQTVSYPTVTKVYLDGGLVTTVSQPDRISNLSSVQLSIGRSFELENAKLDEIYVWDKALSESQIVELFRTTKSSFGKQPKKYVEHKLDNKNIPKPIHGYSSRISSGIKNASRLLSFEGVGGAEIEILFKSLLPGATANGSNINIDSGTNSISVTGYDVQIYLSAFTTSELAQFVNNPQNWPDANQLISVEIIKSGGFFTLDTVLIGGGEEQKVLVDEISNKNLPLQNFTESTSLLPQNSGLISYSTYFNGPYQHSNWKSIRGNEHPVTRKLTTENTNIISVMIPEGPKTITQIINGTSVQRNLPGSRKQGTLLNVKESPVYINNKPLKHSFILKGTTDPNSAFEITHTYANNISYFADSRLNDSLGLNNRKEEQLYDKLLDYYNGNTEDVNNPIQKLVGYTYSETIFPKPGEAGLKETRMRTDYITDQPGYSIDGYDRQLGTQRAFWRDNQDDRMRTKTAYINSAGEKVSTNKPNLLANEIHLPFLTPSMAALENIVTGTTLGVSYVGPPPGPLFPGSTVIGVPDFSDQFVIDNLFAAGEQIWNVTRDINYNNSSELNSLQFSIYTEQQGSGIFPSYFLVPPSLQPELYIFNSPLLPASSVEYRVKRNTMLTLYENSYYQNIDLLNPNVLKVKPSYIYGHLYNAIFCNNESELNDAFFYSCSLDLGLNRVTEIISGKKPWYDNYEKYYEDVKLLSNDNNIIYSTIPEFNISNNIKDLIQNFSGDVRKIKLNNFEDNVEISLKDTIKSENIDFIKEDVIKLNIKGIKKLLPYNGFYPQDRSLQFVNYLSSSYLETNAIKGGTLLTGSIYGESEKVFYSGNLEEYNKYSVLLETLYSPGIFYNLIKSGIAVNWPVMTTPYDRQSEISKFPDHILPFETLLDINNGFNISSSQQNNRYFLNKGYIFRGWEATDHGQDFGKSYIYNGFFELQNRGIPLYSLAINNFLAETINFFLKDSKLNAIYSSPETEFKIFDKNKTYYMDVILRNDSIKMIDAHSSSLRYKYGKMTGRYFGPPFYTGSGIPATPNEIKYELLDQDPAFALYTPPYFYGDSVARLSFKPATTRAYTLDEIFSEINIEYFNRGLVNSNKYPSGSLYSSIAMNVAASVELFGSKQIRNITVSSNGVTELTNIGSIAAQSQLNSRGFVASNDNTTKQWVISTKMETPILDFSSQEYVTASLFAESSWDLYIKKLSPTYTPPTASGFGIGMWSGYGEIPTDQKGIYLELRESFPNRNRRIFENSTTASLLEACGFTSRETTKKLGELADSREISEAIIIIPYSDNRRRPTNARLGFANLSVNDTVSIEGKNLFKINKQIFDYQNNRVNNNSADPVINLQDFGSSNGSIKETSISRMIKLMRKYVLPPNFDFLIHPDIHPFVMYIAEFTSTLDKQDLADIWQGVMPKIAMTAEREEQEIVHKNTPFDFFHGQGLPKDVKFMIFKAKKRAEINYYKMTADSTDDGLFPSIQAGKPPSPYSFNWPYDYCSLVETARVDVEIEYINNSGSNNI